MTSQLLTTSNNSINPDDLSFDLGGGPSGPFIRWHAKGTDDGKVPPRSFSIYADREKSPTDAFEKGVILDLRHIEVGWQQSSGVKGSPPEWRWAEDKTKLGARPSEDWTAGFRLPLLLPDGRVAVWDQASAGANIGLQKLQNRFIFRHAAKHRGQLPKVVMTDVEVRRFGVGATVFPVLEVAEWVDVPPQFGGAEAQVQAAPAERDELDDILPANLAR